MAHLKKKDSVGLFLDLGRAFDSNFNRQKKSMHEIKLLWNYWRSSKVVRELSRRQEAVAM